MPDFWLSIRRADGALWCCVCLTTDHTGRITASAPITRRATMGRAINACIRAWRVRGMTVTWSRLPDAAR